MSAIVAKSAKKLQCPACRGAGGEVDVVLDYGQGPFITCGFCEGKGVLTRTRFYVTLGYVSSLARMTKTTTQPRHKFRV